MSDFKTYLLETLRTDDQALVLHLQNALENPDINQGDSLYLTKAINDVIEARAKR